MHGQGQTSEKNMEQRTLPSFITILHILTMVYLPGASLPGSRVEVTCSSSTAILFLNVSSVNVDESTEGRVSELLSKGFSLHLPVHLRTLL